MQNHELTIFGFETQTLWITVAVTVLLICVVLVERAIEAQDAKQYHDELWRELEGKKKK